MEKSFNEKRVEFVGLLEGLPRDLFIKDEEGNDTEVTVKSALIVLSEDLLKKAKKGSGIKVDSAQQIFRRLLIEAMDEAGELTEQAIFNKFGFGFGRHEALTACRNMHIRVAEGEDMLWAQDVVKEDGTTVYKILGIGAEMPESYKIRRKKGSVDPVKEAPKEEAPKEEVKDEDFEAEIGKSLDIH